MASFEGAFFLIVRRRSKSGIFGRFVIQEPYQFVQDPWRFSANAYEEAFRRIADEVAARPSRCSELYMPLAFLCRHSIELTLKLVIQIIDTGLIGDIDLNKHSLIYLWNRLHALLRAIDISIDESWFADSADLIGRIHNADPWGESFRYPSNKDGEIRWKQMELKELVRSQEQITNYCHFMANAFWDWCNDRGNEDFCEG
jgi:hypothetical protein